METRIITNNAGILKPPPNSFAISKWPKIKTPANIRQALEIPMDETTTCGALIKYEPDSFIFIVTGELVMFSDILGGTNNQMTPQKAANIARYFAEIETVKHCRVEELALFFKYAFSFRYGKLFGAFGWDALGEWWRMFWDERITEAESISIAKHLSLTAHEKNGRAKDETRILTKDHFKKFKRGQ